MRAYSEASKLINSCRSLSRSSFSLCFAQNLNGAMEGQISGAESMKMTHFLRTNHDAILVGVNTIISDNSRLTSRLVEGPSPTPVILDSNLRIPLESHIANRPGALIFKNDSITSSKEQVLRERGIDVIESPISANGINLQYVADVLAERKLKTVMVEGGGKVLQSFVDEDLFDNSFITVNPSYRPSSIGVRNMDVQLEDAKTFQLGNDVFLIWSRNYSSEDPYVEARMPTEFGDLMMRKYKTGEICMYYGAPFSSDQHVPVRVHSSCMTSEIFGSVRCDCAWQLREAMRTVRETGGIVVYLVQEGRGIGLSDKLRAYNLQDEGLDTIEANLAIGHRVDYRQFDSCVNILKNDFEIRNICLLSNNPQKIQWAKENFESVQVKRIVPPESAQSSPMKHYLKTKKDRLGHWLPNGGKQSNGSTISTTQNIRQLEQVAI